MKAIRWKGPEQYAVGLGRLDPGAVVQLTEEQEAVGAAWVAQGVAEWIEDKVKGSRKAPREE